jgi:hypothetical protein
VKKKILALIATFGLCLGAFAMTAEPASATVSPYGTWTTVNAGFTGRPCTLAIRRNRDPATGSQSVSYRRVSGCQSFPVNQFYDTNWVIQFNWVVCSVGGCGAVHYDAPFLTTNTSDTSTYFTQTVTPPVGSYLSTNARVWRATIFGDWLGAAMPPGSSSYWYLVGTYTS